ncbi:MAG: ABC-2 transporter permease [Pseudomonadota bacterium]
MNYRKCVTLVRREIQEHRGLWISPLFALGLGIVALIFGTHLDGVDFNASAPPGAKGNVLLGAMSLLGTVGIIGLITGVVSAIYVLDSLYAERKDRSILFWKSLPVSDAETVMSKFMVAAVIVPLGVILLSLAAQPLIALIAYLRFEPMREYLGIDVVAGWAAALPGLGLIFIYAVLWFAPLTAWLMLASVLAKRLPLMHAALPWLVLGLSEKLMWGSEHVQDFVVQRLILRPDRAMQLLGSGPGIGPTPQWLEPFKDPALWIGLAAAVGMLYIIVRLRRYRDDT